MNKDDPAAQEFCAVWIEQAQGWFVIFGDATMIPEPFPAIGHAEGAALERLGLGQADFDVTEDTGRFYRYQRAED